MSLAAITAALSGCVNLPASPAAPGEQPTLSGTPVRDNRTPLDPAFACFASRLAGVAGRRPVIAVGDVRDYTGKYSVNEGTAITQGGALMVSSALGKLGGGIVMAERFDPTIAERELGYVDHRQLGDGQSHQIAGTSGPAQVAWLPYFGGSIAASDYFIVGGITELNYDIRSRGAELRVGQIGPKSRIYTQSVAIDLRIVNTRSLLVVKTISLTKQFTGYEVGFNTFRFFGSELFDINIGAKAQEPLQLGIRAALEEATLQLVASVTHRDASACIGGIGGRAASALTDALAPTATAAATAAADAARTIRPAVSAEPQPISVAFDVDQDTAADFPGVAGRILAARAHGAVDVELIARDTEPTDPGRRVALTDRRIVAMLELLRSVGVPASGVGLVWRPSASDIGLYRGPAGFQRIARLRVN